MPVGDCEKAFVAAAAADGIVLARARVPWLNQQGHFGLPDRAEAARTVLDSIFDALDGDRAAQQAKSMTSLPGDFVHAPTGTFIEVDESQHFTTYRLRSLDLYPPDTPLGFDLDEYRALSAQWSPKSDVSGNAPTTTPCGTSPLQRWDTRPSSGSRLRSVMVALRTFAYATAYLEPRPADSTARQLGRSSSEMETSCMPPASGAEPNSFDARFSRRQPRPQLGSCRAMRRRIAQTGCRRDG